ncbi:MAG TPA: hypothetical protein VMV77_08900 [Bacteroidales bacterium]|nr:hypothetical protein [Bacteroidales bacterium]
MKVSATKTTPRVERNQYLRSKQIKGYGDGNDYPQKILEIIASSGTGKTCFDTYVKFVRGAGFTDEAFGDTVINDRGERVNSLLSKFAKDLKSFNGFACLVKYDFNATPFAYYNIPFEHCRIQIDSDKSYTGRIAVYSDWTNLRGITFDLRDVMFINRFDPLKVPQEIVDAGGPENYLGQIYYYTDDGDFEYPVCPFDPIITDMLTEESVSTVKHRNAKFNFLPSGVLVRKGIKPRLLNNGGIDPNDRYNEDQADSRHEILRMQGDMNTSKIWVVDVDSDEEKPEFIDFTAKNYDRQFELTEKTVQENIGRMFKVPPILRGVDIGAGFGADLMTNAYDFMNSVTSDERDDIESVFMDLFQDYPVQFTDFSILPKTYVTPVTQTPAI